MTADAPSRVRPATAADAAALAQVQVTSSRTKAPLHPPGYWEARTIDQSADQWRTWTVEHPDDVLLIATTAADAPVGYVLARCEAWHEMDGRVEALHVLPEHRLQGHGRALLHAATTELWARGCGSVGLAVHKDDPVRAWFDLIGGVPVADEVDDVDEVDEVDGRPVRRVVYRWEAAAELARRLVA